MEVADADRRTNECATRRRVGVHVGVGRLVHVGVPAGVEHEAVNGIGN